MTTLDFNSILSLLAAYYIPSQSIERIIEYWSKLDLNVKRRSQTAFFDLQIESLKKIRDQVIDKFCKTDDPHNQKHLKAQTEDEPMKFYNKHIEEIDKKIGNITAESDKQKTIYAIRMWEFGTVLAFVPGTLFAYFGLGVLQMSSINAVDYKPLLPYLDAIFNSVFIGSGTKPIHDAIDAIMSIKKG